MRLAALQLDVRRGRTEENLAEAERGLREAARRGCELVLLPEMWPTSFADGEPGRDAALVAESEAAVARLGELSRELGLVAAGSALGAVAGAARPANRLTVFDRGEEVLRYDKVHLFSPTAEDEGFTAGDEPPPVVATRAGRLSGCVCYDLRFGELLAVPFAAETDLLVCPAQWPAPRESHWRALVHGRAVEGQCFVLACNRTGEDVVGRRRVRLEFPGASLVVDPHGRTVAEGGRTPGLVVAEVDLDAARRMRVRVPVRKDRRPATYARWRRAGGQAEGSSGCRENGGRV